MPYPSENVDGPELNPIRPQGTAFDGSCRWLAIRGRNVEAVLSALELNDATPCSWEDGIARLAEHKLYVSPSIRGWILVVGDSLPDPSAEIDHCFHVLRNLSHHLGSVQFFSANPAVDHHAWARAEDGRILRAYARAEETLWNHGTITKEEKDLEMECLDYLDHPRLRSFDLCSTNLPNSEKLHALADRWSLDPTTVRNLPLPSEVGFSGNIHHFRMT